MSPVPLNATYEPRHVLVSTNWSKAVLRIAAEKCVRDLPNCVYFPSYDIITSPHTRGRYFAEDAREVRPAGVQHVMRLFLKHFASVSDQNPSTGQQLNSHQRKPDLRSERINEALEAFCDEAGIDNQ